jgi:hypothetical protein
MSLDCSFGPLWAKADVLPLISDFRYSSKADVGHRVPMSDWCQQASTYRPPYRMCSKTSTLIQVS